MRRAAAHRTCAASKTSCAAQRCGHSRRVRALMSDTHPGETVDHARSSCKRPLHAHRLAGQLRKDHGIGFRAIAAKRRAPVLAGVIQPADHNFIRRYIRAVFAIRARSPCDCAECVHTVTLPSLANIRRRDERTNRRVPTYGLLVGRRDRLRRAARQPPSSRLLSLCSPTARPIYDRAEFRDVLVAGQAGPVGPLRSRRRQLSPRSSPPTHSRETTATRFPFLTTSAVGNFFLSSAPTEIKVEPSVAGRTIRACSIPGKVTSQLHCVLPVTLSGIPGTETTLPITLNWLTGFSGGSPVDNESFQSSDASTHPPGDRLRKACPSPEFSDRDAVPAPVARS